MTTILNNKIELISGESNILTPGDHTLEDITVTLAKEDDIIINHSVYPNGLIVMSTVKADKITTYSNWNFQLNDDGNYTLIKP